jgi:putative aldouronate transport system substrate-binding protein
MKKIFGIALAAAFLLTMAACSPTGNPTQAPLTSAGAAAETPAATAAEDMTPVTFTVFREDTNANDDNYMGDVSKQILKETGVTIQMMYPVGDIDQKLSLMLAGGDYPDMMDITHQVDMYIQQGALIKLDDLIEQYGPNIKKMYGENLKRLRYNLQDPSIYNLSSAGSDEVRNVPYYGMALQCALLKEEGYPEIKTAQDFENAIKAYKDAHPTIDGKPTIGLSLIAEDWRAMITVRNPAAFLTGKPDDGDWYVDSDNKATLALTRPEEKEYFRWLNHMNDIGLLDPESFVQKYEQYTAKIAAGRVLGAIDATWETADGESALVAAGLGDRTYVFFPAQLDGSTVSHEFQSTGLAAGYGMSITKNCKDPVRAIKFLDYMCSEKTQIMINWGIEGTHYQVVDGKREFLPQYADMRKNDFSNFVKTTGINQYNSTPWPHYGQGAVDSNGDYYDPTSSSDNIVQNYTQPQIDALQAYGATIMADMYPKSSEFPVIKYGIAWSIDFAADSDNKVVMQKYTDAWHKYLPMAVMCKPAEFDGVWDEFQQYLIGIGVEKMEQDFTKLLDDRISLYTK